MAVKKTAEAVETAGKTVEKEAAAGTEPKFVIGKLRENCVALFGVTQSTFDGAMYGHSEGEYTVKEAKAIINGWLYGKGGSK